MKLKDMKLKKTIQLMFALLVVFVGINAKFDSVIAIDEVSNSQPWVVPEWEEPISPVDTAPNETNEPTTPEETMPEETMPEETNQPPTTTPPVTPPANNLPDYNFENALEEQLNNDFVNDWGNIGYDWTNDGSFNNLPEYNPSIPTSNSDGFIENDGEYPSNEESSNSKNNKFKTIQFKEVNKSHYMDTGIKLTEDELNNNTMTPEHFSQLLDYFVVNYDAKLIKSEKSMILLMNNNLLSFENDVLSLDHLKSVFKKMFIEIDFLTSRTNGKYNLADYFEFAGEIPVIVNGEKIQLYTEPTIHDSIALIPIRSIAEALNAKVDWNNQKQIATITKDNTTIIVPLNKDVVSVNGSQYKIPQSSILKNDRTLSTISFIVENLDASMVWDAQINSLVVSSK